jgi:hypothetical protein
MNTSSLTLSCNEDLHMRYFNIIVFNNLPSITIATHSCIVEHGIDQSFLKCTRGKI